MAEIINKKVVENESGQKTTTGRIKLKADTEMLNRANDGKGSGDRRWNKKSSVVVPAGTEVEYLGQETRTGMYHTVTHRIGKNVFYASKKTDDINYGD
jgi:hypothetical protein